MVGGSETEGSAQPVAVYEDTSHNLMGCYTCTLGSKTPRTALHLPALHSDLFMFLGIHCTPCSTLQLRTDLCMSLRLCCGPSAAPHSRQQGKIPQHASTWAPTQSSVGKPWASLCGCARPPSLKYGCLPLMSPTASQIHFTTYITPPDLELVGELRELSRQG